MKATPIIIALAVFGAIPLTVNAQSLPPEPLPTDEVSKTGTGTGTVVTGTESVGNTGTGTGTVAMMSAQAPMPVTLSATNTTMTSNTSQEITVSTQANPDAIEATSGTETVLLSSSTSACKVPASVDLPWTSAEGGAVTFTVSCGRATGKGQTVTITGGTASTSFVLKP